MSAEQEVTNERVYTETEFNYRLEQRTKELRQDLEKAHEALREAKFRAAVAEWAVAGVISRQLSLRVAISENSQAQQAVDLARAVGGNAGAELLHRAELAFKDHAEFSALKMQCPPHVRFQHASGRVEETPFYNWPRPYK
jgi:hypothetical protein